MSKSNRSALAKSIGIGLASGFAVLALLIGGLSLANPAPTQIAQPTASQSVTETATPSATPTPSVEPCLVTQQASSANLPNLQALVVDASTMNVLYDIDGSKASPTASAVKLLTAAVALQTLGPDYRVTTRVYQDATDPSVIYFVGAGDPTLSRVSSSVYKKAPRVSDLAKQITAAISGTQVSKIVVDSSLFKGEQWLSSWPKSERTLGYQSIASALQVDGDRSNPAKATSPRSKNPEQRAGEALRSALGEIASTAVIEPGVMPEGSREIASVKSQPMSSWISYLLKTSDNTLGEALARLSSVEQGKNGDYATIDAVFKQSLNTFGLDTTGLKIIDGSGEGTNNAVPPTFMIALMKQIADEQNGLAVIKKNLPISGKTGSLAWRFTGANKVAVGAVHAKTGWITKGYTLVGYLDARDGSRLLFAVYSLGQVSSKTPAAIDTLVTGFYKCGLALRNQ